MQGTWTFTFCGEEPDIRRLSEWARHSMAEEQKDWAAFAEDWKRLETIFDAGERNGKPLKKLAVIQEDSVGISFMENMAREIHRRFPELEMVFYTSTLSAPYARHYLYAKPGSADCEEFDASLSDGYLLGTDPLFCNAVNKKLYLLLCEMDGWEYPEDDYEEVKAQITSEDAAEAEKLYNGGVGVTYDDCLGAFYVHTKGPGFPEEYAFLEGFEEA